MRVLRVPEGTAAARIMHRDRLVSRNRDGNRRASEVVDGDRVGMKKVQGRAPHLDKLSFFAVVLP